MEVLEEANNTLVNKMKTKNDRRSSIPFYYVLYMQYIFKVIFTIHL